MKKISIAERLLDMFCRNITSLYQCETAETINVHCLRHLAHQCRSFGPLFVFSAMSFESANRILSQGFSGTHSHCAVICRRYLEEHELACTPLEEDGATELLQEWSSVNGEKLFQRRFTITRDRALQRPFSGCNNFFTIHCRRIFFDSSCYRRCPAGPNRYVHVAPYDGSIFGQVVYFVMLGTESLMSGLTFAQIKLLKSQKALFLPECPD